MAKVTEENMYDDLEFTCPKCKTDVVKLSKLEADVGYINRKDGEFVRLCQNCYEALPESERAFIPLMEGMILIGIRSDGEGVIITEEGIATDYKRTITPFELKAACHQIIDDLVGMESGKRMVGTLIQSGVLNRPEQGSKSGLVIPRKR